MDRRQFIRDVTAAGATGLTVVSARAAHGDATVTFAIKGFTCITCALGLEVLLREQKGVARAKASYPAATVAIDYDASMTNEETLKEFINKTTGFTVSAPEKSKSTAP